MPASQANHPAGYSGVSDRRPHRRKASSPSARFLPSRGALICMAIVVCAMVLGGGGTTNPQTETVLQILTAMLLITPVAATDWRDGLGRVPNSMWLVSGLVLVMPVVQLIPLPPSVWHTLPGRQIELSSMGLVGGADSWMPISMAPARTFASFLAMLSAVLVMLQVSRLSLEDRNWVCATIALVAGASLVLGVLQLSRTAGLDWSLYSEFSHGYLVGFQANRNAQADVLLIAMLAIGVLAVTRLTDDRPHPVTWAGFAIGLAAFGFGVLTTGSRTGIAITPIVLIVLVAILWPLVRSMRHVRVWAGALIVCVCGIAMMATQFASVRRVIGRFSVLHDGRTDLWADTSFAIKQVWPVGSGIGTIVPMLEAAERLEVVDPTRPVRAHNDWLEWTLESGLPGLVVLGCIAVVIGILAFRALAARSGNNAAVIRRAQTFLALGALAVIGLHGIVDYPLRSMSLAALTAISAALLTTPAAPRQNTG